MRRLTILLLWAITACGTNAAYPADSDIFEGLAPTAVDEVLANSVAVQKIDEASSDARNSAAQGIVINFLTCREAYLAFRSWLTTGTLPSLDPFPEPVYPTEPSYSANRNQYLHFQEAIESRDIEQLRFALTAEGSCGQWIPATANDIDGPTIKDAIEAGF